MNWEFAKTTWHVRRGVAGLARVHRDRARRAPLGVVERHEVVEHGRTHASALRRVHPLAEEERVEPPREPLDRRPAEPAPSGTQRVRGRQRGRGAAAIGMPSSAARIAAGPRRLVGANATSSCASPAAAAIPASEPRM